MTKLHVEVTTEDAEMAAFEYGLGDGPPWIKCCPVAQALQRLAPGHDWKVDPGATPNNIWVGAARTRACELPPVGRAYANAWDRNYRHGPDRWPRLVSFDLDLPVEVTA